MGAGCRGEVAAEEPLLPALLLGQVADPSATRGPAFCVPALIEKQLTCECVVAGTAERTGSGTRRCRVCSSGPPRPHGRHKSRWRQTTWRPGRFRISRMPSSRNMALPALPLLGGGVVGRHLVVRNRSVYQRTASTRRIGSRRGRCRTLVSNSRPPRLHQGHGVQKRAAQSPLGDVVATAHASRLGGRQKSSRSARLGIGMPALSNRVCCS